MNFSVEKHTNVKEAQEKIPNANKVIYWEVWE